MALPVRRGSEVSRWDPLREFEELSGRMNQLLESAFSPVATASGLVSAWSPAVDIEETDDAYVVEAELPGVKREDIAIELQEGELAITGEVKQRERIGVLRRRTRRTGHFEYRVGLPSDTDADNVQASLNEGVLSVRVPKTAKAQPRRIEISAG